VLLFGGLPNLTVERHAVTASVDYRVSPTTTFGGGVGAGLGGLMTLQTGRRFLVLPGWEVTFSYSRQLLDGRGKRPFLLFGMSGGGSGSATREEVSAGPTPGSSFLYAFDVRGGLTFGKTFWNAVSPYAVARAFGGPVLWSYAGKTNLGSDQYHFQLGVGMVAALPRGLDVFVEGVGAGERALTLGGGKTF
jgi:hypothetical protein